MVLLDGIRLSLVRTFWADEERLRITLAFVLLFRLMQKLMLRSE